MRRSERSGLDFAVLFSLLVSLEGVDHDVQAQNDQQDSQDQLQAVCDEHSAPGGLASGDGYRSGGADGLDHSNQALHQSGEGDAQHDDQRGEDHLVVAAGDLQEHAQGSQNQSAQQLVGGTEQRPDVGVADLGQDEAEHQSDDGGEVHVAQQLAPALSVFHVIHTEQLLEAHTADTGHSVQAGQGQSGNAHGHEHGSKVLVQAKAHKEAGHATAEDLEGGAVGRGAVGGSGCACHAQGDDSQQALQDHGTVTDLQHILFIGNSLGGSAGRNQAVEAGNGTAGHGNEQDGEHGAQLCVVEAGEHRQVHDGVVDNQAQNGTYDHSHEHEGGHVVTGLLQQPHGQHGSEEDVHKGDVAPGSLAQDHRSVDAHHKGQHDEHDADDVFLPAAEVELVLQQAKDHGEHHEHDGDHAGSAVGLSSFHQSTVSPKGVEGACDHVGKGSDDDAAEQPAEQQEQLAAGLADVLLNQHTHGLAVVLDGSIQRAEVGHSTKEDATDQDPQQNGQPAECGSLDGTGDRAGTCDGAELMGKNGPAVGGDVVAAVLVDDCGGLSLGVDAPLVCQPASIEGVSS